MAWSPNINVIDVTQIADNLLTYIEANNEQVLDWASTAPLTSFQAFYTNASGRLQTLFPSLMILSQEVETDLTGDVLIAGLQLTLEGTVSGSDANTLTQNTKVYAKALESMLANIPSATLTANSSPVMQATLFEIETRLDILRGQQTPSAFLQIFQTRCVYQLQASTF